MKGFIAGVYITKLSVMKLLKPIFGLCGEPQKFKLFLSRTIPNETNVHQ